jgi:hypothetical protein
MSAPPHAGTPGTGTQQASPSAPHAWQVPPLHWKTPSPAASSHPRRASSQQGSPSPPQAVASAQKRLPSIADTTHVPAPSQARAGASQHAAPSVPQGGGVPHTPPSQVSPAPQKSPPDDAQHVSPASPQS